MLAIKLRRIGRRHQPAFRLIVAEKRSKLEGRYVEDLGWYNPAQKTREFKRSRVEYWLKTGAKPTDTVHNLLVNAGIITGSKISVHKKSKKTAAPETPEGKLTKQPNEQIKPEKPQATEGSGLEDKLVEKPNLADSESAADDKEKPVEANPMDKIEP